MLPSNCILHPDWRCVGVTICNEIMFGVVSLSAVKALVVTVTMYV